MPAIAELDDQGRVQGVYDMEAWVQKTIRTFVGQMQRCFDRNHMGVHAKVMADLLQYIENAMEEGK